MNKIVATKPREDLPDKVPPLRIINGKERILSEYYDYLQDESKLSCGEIEYIAFPNSELQVAEFLRFASEKNLPVTISNGRTGTVGGAVPQKGVLMSLEKMNKVLRIEKSTGREGEEVQWQVVCQPGVALAELSKAIENFKFGDEKYFYPVDVTETSARLGGTVSTNASGERSFRYGPTRNWIKRLRVVLSNGEVLDISRGKFFADANGEFEIEFSTGEKKKIKIPDYKMPETKNSAGYFAKPQMDLIDLFIGAEGTLGVITEIEIGLTKKPKNIMSLLAFFPSERDSLNFFFNAKNELKTAFVFEYFDSYGLNLVRRKKQIAEDARSAIFFEFEFNDETLENISNKLEKLLKDNNSSMEKAFGGFNQKEIEEIRDIRHALPETINEILAQRKQKYSQIHKISADIAVPENHLLDMIEYYKSRIEPLNLEYTMFGHIGENHLHMNILPRDNIEFLTAKKLHLEFAQKAVQFGGTISAEHGIGKIKHEYLKVMYGIEGLKQMARVKKSLDPKCILNRNNVFPEELLWERE